MDKKIVVFGIWLVLLASIAFALNVEGPLNVDDTFLLGDEECEHTLIFENVNSVGVVSLKDVDDGTKYETMYNSEDLNDYGYLVEVTIDGILYNFRLKRSTEQLHFENPGDQCFAISTEIIECSDSDGGLNYYVKGSVTDENGVWTDFCKYEKNTDYENYNRLSEYYCSNGYKATVAFDCPYGCRDGACVSPTSKDPLLENYPDFFIENGEFNGIIVVGAKAHVEHVLVSIDIATSINDYLGKAEEAATAATGGGAYTEVRTIPVGMAVLDTEVKTLNQNIISVGSPCWNMISQQIMGNPKQCNQGFTHGMGLIKLYSYNDYTHMIVAGYDDMDTRRAARVVANFDEYDLEGIEVCVYGTSLTEIRVGDCVITPTTDYVDVSIYPSSQRGYQDEWVEYELTIQDKHPLVKCTTGMKCMVYYTYDIYMAQDYLGGGLKTSGLIAYPSLQFDYQKQITGYQGESVTVPVRVKLSGVGTIYFYAKATLSTDTSVRDKDIATLVVEGYPTGNVDLILDDVYAQGEKIWVKVKNGGQETIHYESMCVDSFSIEKYVNGKFKGVLTSNPCMGRCLGIGYSEIHSGETETIGYWNQIQYEDDCDERQVEAGRYRIVFNYLSNNYETMYTIRKEFSIKERGTKPICGNGICEPGEGEICVTASCICEEGKACECPEPKCYIVCPEDCAEQPVDCDGCMSDSRCLPYGTRIVEDDTKAMYCDISGSFIEQKQDNSNCQNSYECLSNYCSNGMCVNIQEQLEESRNILQKIFNWLSRIFG